MRKARFAGVSDNSPEAVKPLALGSLLSFDFAVPADEDDARVAEERARSITIGLPFIAASHLICSIALLFTLFRAGAGSAIYPAAGALAGVLLLDAFFSRHVRGGSLPAHAIVRRTAAYLAASSSLWLLAIALATAGGAAGTPLGKAVMIGGIGAAIPVVFLVPALLVLSCVATIGAIALVTTKPALIPTAAGVALFLVGLAIVRARDAVFSAQRGIAAEWKAKKAVRFLADFEQGGRGWFWETDADGTITYVSEPLARHVGSKPAELIGRAFEDVVAPEGLQDDEEGRRTLGFHLGARFPFHDVVIRAPGSEEVWWAISGDPNFDRYGRFLGFRGIGSNLSEQKRSEAETTKLARYDSLTGLPNRAMMRRTLDEALENAAERQRGCALMMIDLDRFKQVNDTLGHPVGDKLLKEVSARLLDVIGEEGQIGRLGGDEFEAILPGIEEEGRLSTLAQRLIEEVSRPYSIEGHRIVIGTSVGIAVALPGQAEAEPLIKEADVALYAAKADGRGTFRFYGAEMHAEAADRSVLESDLAEALKRDQLRLLFQAEVDSVTEEPLAFEALLRWHHPTRGVLAPADFLGLAEESGLMPRIGAWVLRTACAEAANWPRHLRISVNLSPSEFADPALTATVTTALAASQLDPDRLELEITEDAFLADREAPERVMAGLKALGVRLALDNFGTGHSSIAHLRNAPLDKIKIAPSFVRGAAVPGSRDAAILRGLVVLAESLGMDTTAEGIETLEELTIVRGLGCSQVQGFIFGKPLPVDEARERAMASKLPSEAAVYARPPRHRLIRVGTLHVEGATLSVRLRNISEGGAMVECDKPLEPDTRVQLDLDAGGLLDAEVRWSNRGQVGLKFEQAFELSRLRPRRKAARPATMLTPHYLEAQSAPAPAPLEKKPARR